MLRIASLLCLLIFISYPSHAVNINEQDAEKLKTVFQELLDYQKEVNEALGGVSVIYEGDLQVKQESEFYTITFPRIMLKNPELADAGGVPPAQDYVFDVGTITVNAVRDDDTGMWKSIWTFPAQMTLTSSEEEGDFTIHYGGQNTISMIDERLGYFTKLNMNFSDITFTETGKDIGLSVGNVQVYMNFDKKTETEYSGPARTVIQNLMFQSPEDETYLKVAELTVDSTIEDIKLPTLKEYKEKVLRHKDTFQQLTQANITPEEANGVNNKLFDMFSDLYSFEMSGFGFDYTVKGVDIVSSPSAKDDGTDALNGLDNFKLGSANFGFACAGLGSESGSIHLKTSYDDIDISEEQSGEYASVIPKSGNIDFKASKIPFKSLSDLAGNSIKTIADNPEGAQMVGLGLMMNMPAILSKAGTEITIKQSGLKNEIYNASLDGKLMTDLTSLTGFTAKLQGMFIGLDNLISAIPQNEKAQSILSTLQMLRSLGKNVTGPNGNPGYEYDIEATPQGEFLVNGQNPMAPSAAAAGAGAMQMNIPPSAP